MYLKVEDLGIGLVSKYRPGQIPVGGARIAQNIRYYPRAVRRALGFKRIVNELKSEPSILIDGKSHYFYSYRASTGGTLALSTPFSIEVTFRIDSLKPKQTLLWKGTGQTLGYRALAAAGLDWSLTVEESSGTWNLIWRTSTGGAITTVQRSTDAAGNRIDPRVEYHAAVTDDGATISLYLHTVGSAIGSATTGVHATIQDTANSKGFFVGAQRTSDGDRPSEVCQHFMAGIIQEIRFWSATRSSSDLFNNHASQISSGTSNLAAYFKLTGGTGSSFADSKASLNDLELEPVGARRISGLVGSGAITFNGQGQGFPIRSSYLLRDPETDGDGRYDWYSQWGIFGRVKVAKRRQSSTIWHWTHLVDRVDLKTNTAPAPSTATHMNGALTLAGTPEQAQACLEIVEDPSNAGEYQFRFVVWVLSGSTVQAYGVSSAISVGSGGLVEGTEYKLLCVFDEAAATITMYVNGTAGTPVSIGSSKVSIKTDDLPIGAASKYAMELGRAIKQSRKAGDFPGDPNDFDVTYAYDRAFRGTIDQFGFFADADSVAHLATYTANTQITRRTVSSLGAQILLLYPFDESSGDEIEDIGAQSIGGFFKFDPDHGRAKSIVTATTKQRATGFVLNAYRTKSGEQRDALMIQGGSLWRLSNGFSSTPSTLVHYADGIRNDDVINISSAQFMDGHIICTGTGIYHLWQGELYRLSIEPPSGFCGFGLTDQTADEAKLKAGKYRYLFVFESSHTGKKSAPGIGFEVDIQHGAANVAMGEGPEVFQTYPRTGKSINKEDFDLSTGANKSGLQGNAWVGVQGSSIPAGSPSYWESEPLSGGSNDAAIKRVKFTNSAGVKNPIILDKEEVSSFELQELIESRIEKVEVVVYPDGKIELIGRFPGTNGQLYVSNLGGTTQNIVGQSAGKIGFTGCTSGASLKGLYSGDGATDGPPLPFSTDPQVTHLCIYRTTRNGNEYRLLARLRNGTKKFVDNIPDEKLTGALFDVTAGSPPPCKYVVPFNGRWLFFGNKENPQRVWFSKIGEPWNTPPQNVVDFTAGSTLEIIGASVSEGYLALYKDETTFVLSPSTNPNLPFSVQVRTNDSGLVAPHGVVVANEVPIYPAEKGFYLFDGTMPRYISDVIEPTWRAVPSAYRSKIVGAHYRPEETAHWFMASGLTLVDGVVVNDMGISLSYFVGEESGKSYGWATHTGLYVAVAKTIPDVNNEQKTFFIDPFGYAYIFGTGEAYGPDTSLITCNKTVVAASTTTAIKTTQLLSPADGHKGFSITVLLPDGSYETRLCVSDDLASPATLTPDRAFSAAPAVGATLIVGAIDARWTSGQLSPGNDRHLVSQVNRIHVDLDSASLASDVEVSVTGYDGQHEDDAGDVVTIDARSSTDWADARSRARSHEVSISSLGVNNPFEFDSFVLDFESGDEGVGGRQP